MHQNGAPFHGIPEFSGVAGPGMSDESGGGISRKTLSQPGSAHETLGEWNDVSDTFAQGGQMDEHYVYAIEQIRSTL